MRTTTQLLVGLMIAASACAAACSGTDTNAPQLGSGGGSTAAISSGDGVTVAGSGETASSSTAGGAATVTGSGGATVAAATGSGGASTTTTGPSSTATASAGPSSSSSTVSTGTGPDGVSVVWQGGCWYTDGGQKYQAIQFQLTTPTPIPLEGTLFFTTTCDPSQGTDNLNDTGGTIGSGGWLFWFIHHPDETSTSAVWSLDGQSSGCIDYSTAPDC